MCGGSSGRSYYIPYIYIYDEICVIFTKNKMNKINK